MSCYCPSFYLLFQISVAEWRKRIRTTRSRRKCRKKNRRKRRRRRRKRNIRRKIYTEVYKIF